MTPMQAASRRLLADLFAHHVRSNLEQNSSSRSKGKGSTTHHLSGSERMNVSPCASLRYGNNRQRWRYRPPSLDPLVGNVSYVRSNITLGKQKRLVTPRQRASVQEVEQKPANAATPPATTTPAPFCSTLTDPPEPVNITPMRRFPGIPDTELALFGGAIMAICLALYHLARWLLTCP